MVPTSVSRKRRDRNAERECAGCGDLYPRRKLTELRPENHDNLTHFHGDLLCPGCADRAGVER